MKVIHEASVNGITLYFNKIGVILDASHNLDDPLTREIYQFGQHLQPIVVRIYRRRGVLPSDVSTFISGLPENWQEAAELLVSYAGYLAERSHEIKLGYVYLLRHQDQTGLYKIGKTNNPQNRLSAFRLKLPFEVEFELLIHTRNMDKLEKEWHERFAHKRIDGEWFSLDESDVEWMRQDDYRRRQAQKETTLPDEIETWEKQHGIQ